MYSSTKLFALLLKFFPFLTKLPCLLFIPDITYLQNLSYDLTDKNKSPFQMLHIFLEYDVGEFGVTSRQHQLRSQAMSSWRSFCLFLSFQKE